MKIVTTLAVLLTGAMVLRAQDASPAIADQVRAQAEAMKVETSKLKAQLSADITAQVRAQAQQMTYYAGMKGVSGDVVYDAATRALDQRNYADAVRQFDLAIDRKSRRSDGAYYWKAYALNRQGKRDEALTALAKLRQDYPSSAWLRDAQALEAEVRQGSGKPVSPDQEADEDLKLMAINSMIRVEPERAVPLLENLLKGTAAPNIKDRALFVLTQSHTPRALQVLTDYAKGAGNPDLQIKAVRYLAVDPGSQSQLASIYNGTQDVNVKREIIRSTVTSKSTDTLAEIAKSEKDATLRAEALRILASSKATVPATLATLYGSESAAEGKNAILDGLLAKGEMKTLVDLARKESDPAMKKSIVRRLANSNSKDAQDYLMELLK